MKAPLFVKAADAGKTQVFAPFVVINKPLKVKCRCGAIFDVVRELRKSYRKRAYLQGTYRHASCHEGVDPAERVVEIADISQGGLQLRASAFHHIKVDDTLKLSFVLDDDARAKIHKEVQVRHIHNQTIGTQFSPDDAWSYRKELGFYLMPAT